MGQGGYLQITNSTDQVIFITAVHSYQMNNWFNAGDFIVPGAMSQFYIEYDENIFRSRHDDGGDVQFMIGEPSQTFHIHAGFPDDGPEISVSSWSASKYSLPNNISWNHNGTMPMSIVAN